MLIYFKCRVCLSCILLLLLLFEDACQAVRYLLNVIGYDGTKTIDRVGEPPLVLMEMEPEDVQWLKVQILSCHTLSVC